MIEGELLLGRFTVGERIGRGGYGIVHRAWDERLCREVAIKAIEGEAAGRVVREAHAAARLNHTGIVTLYELGEHAGSTYLVTELVHGPNLRQLATSGELSDREVAEIGAELCCALTHAHAQGVIHRDIKPDNVLIRGGARKRTRAVADRAMLADFGIAAVTDAPNLTATGQVVGTLAYMAPEQAAGEPATPAVDIYALALMLYEIWTGTNPVAADNPATTARTIGTELPSLGESRPELPEALCAVIDAALDPDPFKRPELKQIAEVLERTASGLHPDRPVPEPEKPQNFSTLPEEIPLRPFAVIMAAGAIAVLGILAGLPGLAIVAATLMIPAALFLESPLEWAKPLAAPILGLLGAAPAYLVLAGSHQRAEARAALAALGWAWTVVATSILGRALGMVEPANASGWTGSGPTAVSDVLAPLLTPEAISLALVWVGFAVILGAVLDVLAPAPGALAALVWTAGLVSVLAAIGGVAAPGLALTAILVAALALLFWDRAGRPELGVATALGSLLEGIRLPEPSHPAPTPRQPRRPQFKGLPSAPRPLMGSEERVRRVAEGHIRATTQRQGEPSQSRRRQSRRRKRTRISASA